MLKVKSHLTINVEGVESSCSQGEKIGEKSAHLTCPTGCLKDWFSLLCFLRFIWSRWERSFDSLRSGNNSVLISPNPILLLQTMKDTVQVLFWYLEIVGVWKRKIRMKLIRDKLLTLHWDAATVVPRWTTFTLEEVGSQTEVSSRLTAPTEPARWSDSQKGLCPVLLKYQLWQ